MDPFFRKVAHYVEAGPKTFKIFDTLSFKRESFSAGDRIVELKEKVDFLYLVEDGWTMRTRFLPDGRRQIINFQLPGDYFDLMSLIAARSDHSVYAATDTKLRIYRSQDFLKAVYGSAELSAALWWVTVQEEQILREQIVRIGRRSARERIANFLLELNRRQTIYSGEVSDFIPLPVPQALLGDALGLSVVHVSRSLGKLKADGLLVSRRSGITILDRDALIDIADFDRTHLSPAPILLAAQ